MVEKLIGGALIAQSGGPSAVINASLVGAVRRAYQSREVIPFMLGSLKALEGSLNGELVDMYAQGSDVLRGIEITPGAALYSSRKKLGKNISADEVFSFIQERNIRYFFYIGGNDSAENAKLMSERAKASNYDLSVIHIPKTVDNDLRENDHTPGFGSAANFVARAFIGDNLDNQSLPGVKLNVIMGRNAGFLTASSALARQYPGDGPHLIYVPEIPFRTEEFLKDVKRVYETHNRALIAVSEGIADEKGNCLAWNGKLDHHGNQELSGLLLARKLEEIVKEAGITSRVRADVFGYMQRSFPGIVSEIDIEEAKQVGIQAVEFALEGNRAGSVAIKRVSDKPYKIRYK